MGLTAEYKKLKENVGSLLASILTAFVWIIITVFYSCCIMVLWNAVIPELFGLPIITFIQAAILNLLCGFLFRRK